MSAQDDPFIFSPANGGWGQQAAPIDERLCEAENLWGHQCGRGPNSWWVMQDGSTAQLCWQHSGRNLDDPRHRGYRDPRGRPTCEEAEVALKRSRGWHAIKQAKEQSSNMSNAALERYAELEAALTKVTAERDAERERLLCACTYVDLERNGNRRDMARLLGVRVSEVTATLLGDALNVNWICRERVTPTEAD